LPPKKQILNTPKRLCPVKSGLLTSTLLPPERPSMDDPIQIHLTLLPNGSSGTRLNFSALLTPAVDNPTTLPAIFHDWPSNSTALLDGWNLAICSLTGAVLHTAQIPKPVSPTPSRNPNLWQNLFDPSLAVKPRSRDHLKNAWIVSHNASLLHDRHTKYRMVDAANRFVKATADPNEVDTATILEGFDLLLKDFSPRNVYIFPITPADAVTPNGQPKPTPSMQALLADRANALTYVSANTPKFADLGAQVPLLYQRIQHSQKMLEFQENERLTAAGLLAVIRHCLQSLARSNSIDAHITAITADARKLTGYDGYEVGDRFDEIQDYVELHLFTKRPHPLHQKVTQDTPDFHQFLGLLHQYPALLRSLGLVFDFQNVDLNGYALPAEFLARITHANFGNITLDSLYTKCSSQPYFTASTSTTPPSLHNQRFLDISNTDSFSFVTEDSDGTSEKLTQHIAGQARSNEYRGSAPTGLVINDNRAPTTTGTLLPSARTVGVVLYHNDRADAVAQSISRASLALGSVDVPFLIDDLTLGYRVDVRPVIAGAAPQPWRSLHQRNSRYEILAPNGIDTIAAWAPSGTEIPADEGVLSLAITQVQVDPAQSLPPGGPADPGIQLQVHQSLVAWTGWSLSVPPIVKRLFNPNPPKSTQGPKTAVRIRPIYTVPEASLPRLRFGQTYEMRLRHVDVGGNSLPLDVPGSEPFCRTMDSPLARHEPIRGPQILIEQVVDRTKYPSEHADRMVLRDRSARTTRMLVPPRESHQMAVLHGMVESRELKPSAFRDQFRLMRNGSFPSVRQAFQNNWYTGPLSQDESDDQDALCIQSHDRSVVVNPFYPDPWAVYVRIEPYILNSDLASYSAVDSAIISSPGSGVEPDGKAFYLELFPDQQDWPNALPVRIRVESLAADISPRIRKDKLPLNEQQISLPTVDTLTIQLPEGCTLLLQVTSANIKTPSSAPAGGSSSTALRYLVAPDASPAADGPAALPRVSLSSPLADLKTMPVPVNGPPIRPVATPPVAPVAPQQGIGVNLAGEIGPALLNLGAPVAPIPFIVPERPAAPMPAPPLPPPAPRQPMTRLQAAPSVQDKRNQYLDQLDSKFLDGTTHAMTPPRCITLVHAVKTPIAPPAFADGFPVIRQSGQAVAALAGRINAHWPSTSKVTGTAEWTDRIDDLRKPRFEDRKTRDIAFELVNDGKETASSRHIGYIGVDPVTNIVIADGQHHFRDTRAREVTYSLSAFTRFREFYPEAPKVLNDKAKQQEKDTYSKEGLASVTVPVFSSVRPPAPSIAYIIPAYAWKQNKTDDSRGRTMVLRVYLHRPFLVSGNEECLGVVLKPAGTPDPTLPVSRWGGDPIVPSPGGITSNEMSPADFDGGTLQAQETLPDRSVSVKPCLLFEGGAANVLSFDVAYAEDRGLWYCDIPLAASKTASAFARLALVRWQPYALQSGVEDLRLSQVVFADFIQVRPDRWVHVQKTKSTEVSVSVSGVFRSTTKDREEKMPTFRCTIEHRWHRLGEDMGWRPLKEAPAFVPPTAVNADATSVWTSIVTLPYSMALFKYRLLIEELEWIDSDASREPGSDISKTTPKSRATYLHYINL
jgi:hypothetical protein